MEKNATVMEAEGGEHEHGAAACKPGESTTSTVGGHRKNKGGWEITAQRPNTQSSNAA